MWVETRLYAGWMWKNRRYGSLPHVTCPPSVQQVQSETPFAGALPRCPTPALVCRVLAHGAFKARHRHSRFSASIHFNPLPVARNCWKRPKDSKEPRCSVLGGRRRRNARPCEPICIEQFQFNSCSPLKTQTRKP